MGKIADALGKYAQERKSDSRPELTGADLDVLLAHNRKTGHLLNYDNESGQIRSLSLEVLSKKGTIKRLLDNELIYPGGELTSKGIKMCELRQQIVQDQAPPVKTGKHTVEKPTDQSRTVDTPTRAEEGVRTSPQSLKFESPPITRHASAKTPQPQEIVIDDDAPREAKATAPDLKIRDISARAYVPRSKVPGVKFKKNLIHENLISLKDQQAYESEQFKILRTNILFPVSGTAPQLILVTSAMPGEGKSFVSANLAISIALNINKHVLLIDCDLRKPDVHRMFGFREVPGLSDYLRGTKSLESLLVKTSVDKLTLLPGGSVPPNPSELMSTDRMSKLFEEVKHRYPDRLIVIDSPPPGLAAETAFLARHVESIVLVVKHGKTPREEVAELIEKMGTEKILGIVVNMLDLHTTRRYGYKKYGRYGNRYGR